MSASVRLEVFGLNGLKLLNALRKENIEVSSLSRKSPKEMSFSIRKSDLPRVIELIDKQGSEYKIVSEKGPARTLKSALARLGLAVGFVVAFVLSMLSTEFLWKIEVTGNDRVDDLTIIKALRSGGISVGKRKNFDKALAEETIMGLDDISAVSVELLGTTLKIDVVESAVVSPPKAPGDIVSFYDAEVTRIVVNSGTPMVKIGDRVPIGALLIEGKEYGTDGIALMDVSAQGEVYGKVNFTYSETATLKGGKQRTGATSTCTVLKFFGLTIGKRRVPEGDYESEKTVSRIGSMFPFYAETTRFYELGDAPDLTLDELKQKIEDKAVSLLIIKAGGSPVDTLVTATEVAEGLYKVTVHIEAEVSIGGKRID